MSDEAIRWLGPNVLYFERALARIEGKDDPEKTLFVQLTPKEVILTQFALMWVCALYGYPAIAELSTKFHEVIEAQAFCDCPNCRAERDSREENA